MDHGTQYLSDHFTVSQTRRMTNLCPRNRVRYRKRCCYFKIKVTLAGNDTYEAWRESDHDDLVRCNCRNPLTHS